MNPAKDKRPIIAAASTAVVALVLSVIWYAVAMRSVPLSFVAAKEGTVVEDVSASGVVKAAENVALGFEVSGRIVAVGPDVGAPVKAGDILAELDASDLQASLAQAEANVAAAEARLNQLEKGARPEQIQVQESTIAAAEATLDQSIKAAVAEVESAYSASDDAVHHTADQFFSSPTSISPQLSIPASNGAAALQAQSDRASMESLLASWNASTTALTDQSSPADVSAALTAAEANVGKVQSFMDEVAALVNGLTPTASITSDTLAAWKLGVSTARGAVSGANAALVAAESAYKGAAASLDIAKNQLTLEQAGGVADDIDAQQAVVDAAEANVRSIDAQIAKRFLRAPISGTIARQDAKVGQTSVPNQPIVSIVSESAFQVDAYVPETDIGKMQAGDAASITLDAYGNDIVFPAKVVTVDPAETLVGSVPSYKVTLEFAADDPRIRSGMTANAEIQSSTDMTGIVVPQTSVIKSDGSYYALVALASGKGFSMKPIQVGLKGSDGMILVVSGLSEGDRVASFGASN